MEEANGRLELSRAVLTTHAPSQMARRQVSKEQVQQVLDDPQAILPVRNGRVVAQRLLVIDTGNYLLRVFVDVDRTPPEVVTVYRTSKTEKYGKQP